MKPILSFVAGFVLAAVLFASGSLHAQSTPVDYLKKAEIHILAMSSSQADIGGDNTDKHIETYKAAQKFFNDTKPAKGFAAFHSYGLFAANYCMRAAEATVAAKKDKSADNPFFAGILIQLINGCSFSTQDALTLWLEAKGD